jgi:hypothetical protein
MKSVYDLNVIHISLESNLWHVHILHIVLILKTIFSI